MPTLDQLPSVHHADDIADDIAEAGGGEPARKRGPRSDKPQRILTWLQDWFSRHDYPPAIRDVVSGVGLSSTSVADYNLRILERDGKIKRDRERARTITLVQPEPRLLRAAEAPRTGIPLMGAIAAGTASLVPDAAAAEQAEQLFVTPEMLGGRDPEQRGIFAVTVRGDSMIDALIADGDTVILEQRADVSNSDLAAVYMRDEEVLTLKRFFREDGRIRLQPENPAMAPIYTTEDNVEIQGRVVSVLRSVN